MKKLLAGTIVILFFLYLASPWLLTRAGEFLVVEAESIEKADAVVVLRTGVDYLPRLMQAAALYRQELVYLVVINGNRKTDVHRRLEARGFSAPHPWYDEAVAALVFLGVEKGNIITISAEDAYDTISEAAMVGQAMAESDINRIIITTSKFHTRRAKAIWHYRHAGRFELQVVAAADDPFAVDGWWQSGRQIRQVLSEYGAWLYFWGKRLQR